MTKVYDISSAPWTLIEIRYYQLPGLSTFREDLSHSAAWPRIDPDGKRAEVIDMRSGNDNSAEGQEPGVLSEGATMLCA